MLPPFYQISLKPSCALEPYRCCFRARFLQSVLGDFASPCSFQGKSVNCTGWSEMSKFGNLKAAGPTQEYHHTNPSLFWGRSVINSESRKVMAVYMVLLVTRRGRLASVFLHCLWCDTLCCWDLLLNLGALDYSLEPGLWLYVFIARIFWANSALAYLPQRRPSH